MWHFKKKNLYNKIDDKEVLVRHILAHQFDFAFNEANASAFQVDHIKKGLSLSIKSKLNLQIRTKLIKDLEKVSSYQCDYEAIACQINKIIDDNGKNIYELLYTPINNHPAHAEVKFCPHVLSASTSLLKKYRKLLMDEFIKMP